MKAEHTLNILGREFNIVSEESADRIKAVEALVNEHVGGLGANPDVPLQGALLLATLNLAQELLGERARHQALKEKIRKKSSTLLRKLESISFAA